MSDHAKGQPEWTCAECGSRDGCTTVYHAAGDCDLQCNACGGTEICESPAEALISAIRRHDDERAALLRALDEIAVGAGPFSRNALEHASNTIEAMKAIARAAIARAMSDQPTQPTQPGLLAGTRKAVT